ncbi:MAG: anthranilate phosphoribosyltransferase [Tepidisphaeraceae bacterium]
MAFIRDILLKLCRREDLTRDEARRAFIHIMSGEAAEAQIGGLLVGLAAKGTTVEELVGASTVMREKVIPIDCDGIAVVLDTCGTGGDIRHTFNISTAAALVAAGAGIKVVKHGNRAASGHSGAADVLEKLGLRLELPPADLRRCLDRANICFAFARSHHPAMKHVADARKALGIPSIFNLLGPLTNPGQARHQLLGVFAPERRAWVVHAEDGLDEISTLGPTRISELRDGHIQTWTLDPKDFAIPYARLSDLQISTVEEAADALTSVLNRQPGPKRDIALLNAAAAMVVAERAKDLNEGLEIAQQSLDEGKAAKALELLIAESNAG